MCERLRGACLGEKGSSERTMAQSKISERASVPRETMLAVMANGDDVTRVKPTADCLMLSAGSRGERERTHIDGLKVFARQKALSLPAKQTGVTKKEVPDDEVTSGR